MIGRTRRSILAAVVILSCALAHPAYAQITTGTVTGSVRDGQGAVVPGATVTLVSASRGTSVDAQTNFAGDFVFPNVSPGTYLVRIAMDGFKTLERPGIVVSPGDRVLIPTLTIEVGALSETVTVQAESPIIQVSSGERSFTVTTSPNAAIITNRNTTMNLQNPNDPVTIVNLPYENGALVDARSRPRGAGFGVATDYQNARSVQFQARFSF